MCRQGATVDDLLDHLDTRAKKMSTQISLARLSIRGVHTKTVNSQTFQSNLKLSLSVGKMLPSKAMA